MSRGTPIELLYRAHRDRGNGLLVLEGPLGIARIWIGGGRVRYLEGIPPLDPLCPDDVELARESGPDLEQLFRLGVAPDQAIEAMAEDLADYLGRVVERGDCEAAWTSGVESPPGAFPLTRSAMWILSRGLRAHRHPDAVAAALKDAWDVEIHCEAPPAEALQGLDPIAIRTLRHAMDCESLGDLVLHSGRGSEERARHAWRAIDLLLQLRLLRLGAEDTDLQWSEDVTGPLPSMDEAWEPAHQPEDMGGAEREISTLFDHATRPLARLGALCVEVNPLVICQLETDALHGPVTTSQLERAYRNGMVRFAPGNFLDAAAHTLQASKSLASLLRDGLESVKTPLILAAWLRDLRAFQRPDRPDMDSERKATELFEESRDLAADRHWNEALAAVTSSLTLDPTATSHRILQVFLLVATRRMSPEDGVLNLDGLDLEDPRAQAQAQVTAGRLLKAARRPNDALDRFRMALRLDPDRRDARMELEFAKA
jgi:tetratricopeptide (TPR) repeat protein